jgi:hypothetical protein
MRHLIKKALPALTLVLAAGTSTGCSGPPMPRPVPPTPAASTPAAQPTPATAAPSAPATSGPATAATLARACTPEVLLPWMKRRFDDPSKGLVIERVYIKRCLNGYAHVFAITRRNPPGDPRQYENEQLFLHLVDGQWQSIAEGTGISCSDDDLRPELVAPCRGLGY